MAALGQFLALLRSSLQYVALISLEVIVWDQQQRTNKKFWFCWSHDLCNACMCTCVCQWRLAGKHNIWRREPWANLRFVYGMEYKNPKGYRSIGVNRSNFENHVNMISQEGKHGLLSYLVCTVVVLYIEHKNPVVLVGLKVIWVNREPKVKIL